MIEDTYDDGDWVPCYACDGTGEDDSEPLGECAACGGSGERWFLYEEEYDEDAR